jgi:hypothetical protein
MEVFSTEEISLVTEREGSWILQGSEVSYWLLLQWKTSLLHRFFLILLREEALKFVRVWV